LVPLRVKFWPGNIPLELPPLTKATRLDWPT
jgi:hypothetical protein